MNQRAEQLKAFERLLDIMDDLREKCPWDRKQTFDSLRQNTIEETYELAALLGQYHVDYVWSGHQHARQSVFFRGVNYLVLDATKDSEKGQSYMTVQMGEHAIYHYIDYPNANH